MVSNEVEFNDLKQAIRDLIESYDLKWVSVSYDSPAGPGVFTIEKDV